MYKKKHEWSPGAYVVIALAALSLIAGLIVKAQPVIGFALGSLCLTWLAHNIKIPYSVTEERDPVAERLGAGEAIKPEKEAMDQSSKQYWAATVSAWLGVISAVIAVTLMLIHIS